MTPERFATLHSVLTRRQPDLTVITDYVHKGRNLSAIVRTADAVGIGDVHCAIGDKDYQAFRGTALGSHRWVNVHRYRSVGEPISNLQQQGFQIVAAHLSAHAVDYHDIDYTRPTAVLLGAEKVGVSAESRQRVDAEITIPMVGMVGSLNVSVAAGIILAEAQRQRQLAGCYEEQRISAATYQRLLFEWAHPQLRQFCQQHQLEYPPLREDGELLDAPGWYAEARERIQRSERESGSIGNERE